MKKQFNFVFGNSKKLFVVWSLLFGFSVSVQSAPGYFNTGDIAVINAMIDNNGLNWTKAPADGSFVPYDWQGLWWWSDNDTNYRIISMLMQSSQPLTGDLDLTGLTRLKFLDCSGYKLTSLNVANLTELELLNCSNFNLRSLNISGLVSLQTLNCGVSDLDSLDVSGLINLQTLNCSSNRLVYLNVTGCTGLKDLLCFDNQLESIELSGLNNLVGLICARNNLTTLDVTSLDNLLSLECSFNYLDTLIVSGLNDLSKLSCAYNRLTSLDLSGLSNLRSLLCDNNPLTSLDVSGLDNLWVIQCIDNNLTSINVSGLKNLQTLNCDGNCLTSIDFTSLASFEYLNFHGENQHIAITLSGNAGNYTANVIFGDGTTFENPALFYENEILTSTSASALTSGFSSPTGVPFRMLSGTITLSYPDNPLYTVNIGTLNNGSVSADKSHYEAGETVTLLISDITPGYELNSISAYKTDDVATSVILDGLELINGAIYTFSMPAYNITVTAIFDKSQAKLDEETLTTATTIIESTLFEVAQDTANTETDIKRWLINLLNDLLSNIPNMQPQTSETSIIEDVTMAGLVPAIAGTDSFPTGTNGFFKFTVTLTCGESILTTDEIPGVILSSPYVEAPISSNTKPQIECLQAYKHNGILYVRGLIPGNPWYIYSISGTLIYCNTASSDEANICLSNPGVYIVKTGSQTVKVQ